MTVPTLVTVILLALNLPSARAAENAVACATQPESSPHWILDSGAIVASHLSNPCDASLIRNDRDAKGFENELRYFGAVMGQEWVLSWWKAYVRANPLAEFKAFVAFVDSRAALTEEDRKLWSSAKKSYGDGEYRKNEKTWEDLCGRR